MKRARKLAAYQNCVEFETPCGDLLVVREEIGTWVAGKKMLPERMTESELAEYILSLVMLHREIVELNRSVENEKQSVVGESGKVA